MDEKIILITGSTDGIGKQTALELSSLGHKIIIHGRNEKRIAEAINEIERSTKNKNLFSALADLSSLKQVKNLATEIQSKFDHIDVLINNAGVYMNEYVITEDGFEMTFAVNHLSHFLLTNLLIELIKKSKQGRIINVSSIAHQSAEFDFENLNAEKGFSSYGAYALSKFANILFTKALAKKLKNTDTTVNALHPGVISTKLLKAGFNILGASVKKGAETSVYLAVSSEVKNVSGEYFIDKKIEQSHPLTYKEKLWEQLWDISSKMVGLNHYSRLT